jgi:hypothetical protein
MGDQHAKNYRLIPLLQEVVDLFLPEDCLQRNDFQQHRWDLPKHDDYMMITGHSFPPLSLVRSRLARHNLVWSTMMSDIRKRTTNHKKHQETNSADTGVSEIQTISRYLKLLQLSIYLGNGTLTLFWPLLPWNIWNEWPLDPLDWARDVRKPPSANSRSVSSAGIKMNL